MSNRKKIIASYDYRDEAGELLYQVVRFEPKGFRQRRPDGMGGLNWSMKGVRRVIYRLPEVIEAVAQKRTIFIAEGEKSVDALVKLGVPATCSPGGAEKWRDEYSQHLSGANVVILPDNDEAGERHCEAVARSLAGIAGSVRVLRLPGLPTKGDAYDWVKTGGTAQQLQQFVEVSSVEWTADGGASSSPDADHLLDELAGMSPAEYGSRRKALANELDIPLAFLDREYNERRKRPTAEDNSFLAHAGGTVEHLQQFVEESSVEWTADGGASSSPDADHLLDELAGMSPAQYGGRRKALANEFDIPLAFLDREYNERRKGTAAEGNSFLLDPDPWPDPVDGAELLEQLADTVASHLVLPAGAADAIALWVLFTHAHDCFDISPVLGITSPTPECGKTTLLTFLDGAVPRPLPASNITPAAVFRAVEKWGPTLLIDEADTFLQGSDELRGILNSGHKRSTAYVIRTAGEDHEPKSFHTWAPKAVALIGKLPATLASRAIHIALRRKRAVETVTPLRLDRLDHLETLRSQAARWAADHASALRKADPQMPATVHGRAADNWRSLVAIADVAGGGWPDRARCIAEKLAAKQSEGTTGVMLLQDIKQVLSDQTTNHIGSAALVKKLTEMEHRPWPEWRHGSPITRRQLAGLLEPFGIAPSDVWTDQKCLKGYKLSQFEDAFIRYLGGANRETARTVAN